MRTKLNCLVGTRQRGEAMSRRKNTVNENDGRKRLWVLVRSVEIERANIAKTENKRKNKEDNRDI